MTNLVVQLAGVNVERIMSMSLRLAVRELADTVQVEIIDDRRVTELTVGESFAVAIRGRIVFVGEVLTMQRGARADSFSITALSSAARMVKSSIIIGDSVTSRVFRNRSLRQIIEQVAAPFYLVIDVAAGLTIVDEPIDRVRIKRHEMAFDFCSRVAKRQGCILVSGAASVTAERLLRRRRARRDPPAGASAVQGPGVHLRRPGCLFHRLCFLGGHSHAE